MPEPFKKLLAQRLMEARERAGLSQTELGQAAGTSQSAVQRIESGERKRFSKNTMAPYAAALKVPLSELWPVAQLSGVAAEEMAAYRSQLPPEDTQGFDEFMEEFGARIAPRELEILRDLQYTKGKKERLTADSWRLMWIAIRAALDHA